MDVVERPLKGQHIVAWFPTRRVAAGMGVAIALSLGSFQSLAGQFAGVPGGDGFSAGNNMAEYYADIIFNVTDLTERWRHAWAANDLEALEEFYHPNATLIAGDENPIRGRDAVMERITQMVQSSDEIQTAIADFDASGRMGWVSGLFTIESEENGNRQTLTGIHSSVFLRYKGDWVIRSQVFRIDSHDVGFPGGS